jgi:hypothetical protein
VSAQITAMLEACDVRPFPRCRDTDEVYCPVCGEPYPTPSVEAFEVFDAVCCIDCGAAMFDADDGQPDEAQEWASFDPEC